jgi:hypothetical protein
MSIRELARQLGISPTRVAQLVKKGMPTATLEEARRWRMQYIAPPTTAKSNVVAMHEAGAAIGSENGDLSATLQRLRHVERSTSAALERLIREGKIAEAAVLRREHVATVKALFDAESKSIKIGESRGRLISADRAPAMTSEAIAEPIIMLRQLPSMARDDAERAKFEAIVAGILAAMREGATRGLKLSRGGSPEVSSSDAVGGS